MKKRIRLSTDEMVQLYLDKESGTTAVEIARALGIPKTTVYSIYETLRPYVLGKATTTPQKKYLQAISEILLVKNKKEDLNLETPPVEKEEKNQYDRLKKAFIIFQAEVELFLETTIKENMSVLLEKNRLLLIENQKLKDRLPKPEKTELITKEKKQTGWAKILEDKIYRALKTH